jgi:hypothetical protein
MLRTHAFLIEAVGADSAGEEVVPEAAADDSDRSKYMIVWSKDRRKRVIKIC